MTNYSSKGTTGEIPSFYHHYHHHHHHPSSSSSSEDKRHETRKIGLGLPPLPPLPLSSTTPTMTSSILSFPTMGPTSATPNNTHNNHSPRSSSSSSHRSPTPLSSSVPFPPPYSSPQQLFQSIAAAAAVGSNLVNIPHSLQHLPGIGGIGGSGLPTNSSSTSGPICSISGSGINNNNIYSNNKRTRHRVDAGEPRGCFQQNFYNSYESKMLTDYSQHQQQLLRDMLVNKIGFEEDVKVNGCKKRKLYQPIKNEIPSTREGASPIPQIPMLPNNNNHHHHHRRNSMSPTPPLTNGNVWGGHPLPPHLRSGSTPLAQQLGHHSPPPFPLQIPFQWKESFKNNILATIGDLIDAQFAALNQLKEGSPFLPQQSPRVVQQPLPPIPHVIPIPPPQPPVPRNFFPNVIGLRPAAVGLSPPYPPPTDSPLSLVMTPNTKKKRQKVTDTRLPQRNVLKPLDDDEKYFGKYDVSPPASLNEFVNSQLDDQQSDDTELSGGNDGTVRSSDGGSTWSANGGGFSSTLTPMHLRKAKLMFFWVRYPSSSVLKMYFPDIKFNKNNTAQLVKWFSNFREFYYIQMEKYARASLAEGVKSSEDLQITTDSELYRLLNLHYNRNNHIEVPTNFRFVVEQTLREFFKAVHGRKDTEQSWKKTIYKIIARLDDPVPESFKKSEFLETLE